MRQKGEGNEVKPGRHDTRHNDTLHETAQQNDTQHSYIKCNDTQNKWQSS
jgi:hypothetical protein